MLQFFLYHYKLSISEYLSSLFYQSRRFSGKLPRRCELFMCFSAISFLNYLLKSWELNKTYSESEILSSFRFGVLLMFVTNLHRSVVTYPLSCQLFNTRALLPIWNSSKRFFSAIEFHLFGSLKTRYHNSGYQRRIDFFKAGQSNKSCLQ